MDGGGMVRGRIGRGSMFAQDVRAFKGLCVWVCWPEAGVVQTHTHTHTHKSKLTGRLTTDKTNTLIVSKKEA
jgi:hypothetical protein